MITLYNLREEHQRSERTVYQIVKSRSLQASQQDGVVEGIRDPIENRALKSRTRTAKATTQLLKMTRNAQSPCHFATSVSAWARRTSGRASSGLACQRRTTPARIATGDGREYPPFPPTSAEHLCEGGMWKIGREWETSTKVRLAACETKSDAISTWVSSDGRASACFQTCRMCSSKSRAQKSSPW